MLGFCFRFSLKVPGSDTSCDDGDKKGFHFVVLQTGCATPAGGADRAYEAGWGDGGVELARCARLARWTLVTSGNRPGRS